MVTKLKSAKAKVAELKASLDADVARDCCLEGELVRLKAAQAEEVRDATRRVAADQPIWLNALLREVTFLKHANKDSQAGVRRLTENHARDQEKILR